MSGASRERVLHVVVGSLVATALTLVASAASPQVMEIPGQSGRFEWAPAAGPVGWYWTCAHRDEDALRIKCAATTEPTLTLFGYSFDEGSEFFLVSQAWTADMTGSGKYGPCSDLYRFPVPVPEPAAAVLLASGVGFLMVISTGKGVHRGEPR